MVSRTVPRLLGLSRLLKFRSPLIEYGSFNRTDGKTSATVDTGRICSDISVFRSLRVRFAFGPNNAIHRANWNAVANALADVCDNRVRHNISSTELFAIIVDLSSDMHKSFYT